MNVVWTNVGLSPSEIAWLESKIAPFTLRFAEKAGASNLTAGTSDEGCRTADVAFGQPAVDDVLASTSLKWVHLTSAGYTRYDRDDLRIALKERGATLTNSSSVYDDPCAQHVLAFILAECRRIVPSVAGHHGRRWDYEMLRSRERVLRGDHVLIVGYGAIGRRLVELLAPFNVKIRAIRRTPRGDEGVETFPIDRIDQHLGWARHVVNILPANESTNRLFNRDRFEWMSLGATFYNVGRGDTVDQPALIDALRAGRLGAAYLDVTTPEPLPPDDPLWAAPNVFITPHVAGGLQSESQAILDHFAANFAKFRSESALDDVVF